MSDDLFSELKELFGKSIDSEEVVAFLANYPKHRVAKPDDGHQSVLAPAYGFEMTFSPYDGSFHGGRTKASRVLNTLFLNSSAVPKFKAFSNLPLGLSFDYGPEQLIAKLGTPIRSGRRDNGQIAWLHWDIEGLVLNAAFNNESPKVQNFALMNPTESFLKRREKMTSLARKQLLGDWKIVF